MPKYHVVFAHADTRETNGELVDETPKGWGDMDIYVDHEIVTDDDKVEVARQIAWAGTETGDQPRFSHVAIRELTRLDDEILLTETDFIFLFDANTVLHFTPLGEDDFAAFWGHGWSSSDILGEVTKYFTAAGVADVDDIIGRLEAPKEVWAWAVGTGKLDETSHLEWSATKPDDRESWAVTILDLR